MRHILLTGAGFSRNWGGWLAYEVFEYLIGSPLVDASLRKLLWETRTKGGFEAALTMAPADQLDHLERAVGQMFQAMNAGLLDTGFNDRQAQAGIRNFLASFDQIFTLNQDVLLEHHYFKGMDLIAPLSQKGLRWTGCCSPGVAPRRSETDVYWYGGDPLAGPCVPVDRKRLRIERGIQPYFKLHGSSNWHDAAGGALLIVGGIKKARIAGQELLDWYWSIFRESLSKPSTRLVIVGYGFGDEHVNEELVKAVALGGLEIFLVDPYWTNSLLRWPDHERIVPAIVGLSSRDFRAAFEERDPAEFNKIVSFLTAR